MFIYDSRRCEGVQTILMDASPEFGCGWRHAIKTSNSDRFHSRPSTPRVGLNCAVGPHHRNESSHILIKCTGRSLLLVY